MLGAFRSGRRVGRGAIPRPVKVDPPFPHAGPAPRVAAPSGSLREGDTNLGQVQSKPKRSPLEINPQAERGVWCVGCGCVVVCRRLPSGLALALKTPLPRARWGELPRELSPMYPCLCVPHRARRVFRVNRVERVKRGSLETHHGTSSESTLGRRELHHRRHAPRGRRLRLLLRRLIGAAQRCRR